MVEPQSFDKENLLECKRSSTTGFDNSSIKQSSDTIEKKLGSIDKYNRFLLGIDS